MEIITMSVEHLERVRELSLQLGYEASLTDLRDRWEVLQSNPHHRLLVYVDRKVLGWIHFEEVFDLIEPVKVEIKALVVDEAARSTGVGKSLIRAAREWSKIRNRDIIYLNCNIVRDRAHAFYKREGFTLNKTSHFFEQKV
jgi:GNAT superfamily N-acetyltransferase